MIAVPFHRCAVVPQFPLTADAGRSWTEAKLAADQVPLSFMSEASEEAGRNAP